MLEGREEEILYGNVKVAKFGRSRVYMEVREQSEIFSSYILMYHIVARLQKSL